MVTRPTAGDRRAALDVSLNVRWLGWLRQTLGHQDLLFAAGIVALVAVLVLPMPTWLVDIGLSTSITLSVLILMVAIWIEKPLDFSVFPTVLLVATLLRLALNLATVRLILANGHKGLERRRLGDPRLRRASSSAATSSSASWCSRSWSIINFMVITKGAGRIAEVAARFSLDAMPGKQMAIDADLSAGMITDEQARRRRKELEEESSFFGAMDGASKFVRGDAVAAIIVTLVNVIGGIVMGTLRHGLGCQPGRHVLHHADHRRRHRQPDPGADRQPGRRHAGVQGFGAAARPTAPSSASSAVIRSRCSWPSGLAGAVRAAARPAVPAPFAVLSTACGGGAMLVRRVEQRRAQAARLRGPLARSTSAARATNRSPS